MLRVDLKFHYLSYITAVLGIGVVTAVCVPLVGRLSTTVVAMAMLLAVMFTASSGGRWPGLVASLLGALSFDYFFLPPVGSFTIASPQDWVTFGTLAAVAVTVGELSERVRRRAREAETERARANRERDHIRGLIEASLDPLVTIGSDGRITDANAAAAAITGCPRSALIGTYFSNYFTDPVQAGAGYRRAFQEGFVRDFPLMIRHGDGPGIPVLYNASVFRDRAGGVEEVFAAARDISALISAEDEIRHLASFPERAPVSIVEFGPDLAVKFVNPAMQQSLVDCAAEDVRRFVPTPWRAKLARGEGGDETGVAEVEIDGRCFEEHLYLSREFQSLRIWVMDITERKRAERELANYRQHLEELVAARTADLTKANESLDAANKELEAFSYSVSHDLRVPLRAIDGFSRILVEDYADRLDDEGRRLVGVVRESTRKMGRLIDDILAFSRVGRVDMTLASVDMDEVVRATLEELQPAMAGRNLTVDVGRLPQAEGDPVMIARVWNNLLDNAVKFTGRTPEARIDVGGEAAKGELVYHVKDNGAGFDMAYADKLFGVFQRLHGVEEFPGTGIGLAIVKRIVTRHGGRVWAEGKPDEGATFYFALPVRGAGHVE
jgi:PAS domain S-box-containing protein